MGPHEPYWRTNTSFSPPPPNWNFRFHSDVPSFNSQEGSRLYGSSTSSNSRESRNWLRTNHLPHRNSNSDGIGTLFSSPSELSPAQQWTPPIVQEISLHEYATSSSRALVPLSFSPTSEGFSVPNEGSRPSISSNSDNSDYDTLSKSHNFTGRGCFMSKPVHPLSIPVERNNPGIRDSDASCDFEFSDVSEPMESDSKSSRGDKCGLCERFLSQRSPWSSRQIIRSGDFPVTGVLSCRHVFHAECLDQTTPKTHKGDPPCPICVKSESNKNSNETRVLSTKLKNGFPRVKTSCEDAMLLLNQNRIKKGVLVKGNSGKLKKSGTGSPPWGGGEGVGSSKSASSSRKKS